MSLLSFQYRDGGLHFPRLGLHLDAPRAVPPHELAFISHAHADHVAPHPLILATPETQALLAARMRPAREVRALPFHQTVPLAELAPGLPAAACRVAATLLPAGHILGSAMLHLACPEGSLLYTADFQLRPSPIAGVCQPRAADTLVIESTFGRSHYRFPSLAALLPGLIRFCRSTLADGEVPVLLGYSLGKAQEILSLLAGTGLPFMLSPPVESMTRVHQALGCRFPPWSPWDPDKVPGHVLLHPPGASTATLRRQIPQARIALLSGWALDPAVLSRGTVEAAFPLSDHADFDALNLMVRQVQPRQVYTLHGFAEDFARHLVAAGFDAIPLARPRQLSLDLRLPLPPPPADSRPCLPLPPDPPTPSTHPALPRSGPTFHAIAEACLLADAAASVPRPLPDTSANVDPTDSNRRTKLRQPPPRGLIHTVRSLVGLALGLPRDAFHTCHILHNDLSRTVEALFQSFPPGPPGPRLLLDEVAPILAPSPDLRNPIHQQRILRVLRRCSPLEARCLVLILQHRLRLPASTPCITPPLPQPDSAPSSPSWQ